MKSHIRVSIMITAFLIPASGLSCHNGVDSQRYSSASNALNSPIPVYTMNAALDIIMIPVIGLSCTQAFYEVDGQRYPSAS